jgi:hypothetical protein
MIPAPCGSPAFIAAPPPNIARPGASAILIPTSGNGVGRNPARRPPAGSRYPEYTARRRLSGILNYETTFWHFHRPGHRATGENRQPQIKKKTSSELSAVPSPRSGGCDLSGLANGRLVAGLERLTRAGNEDFDDSVGVTDAG